MVIERRTCFIDAFVIQRARQTQIEPETLDRARFEIASHNGWTRFLKEIGVEFRYYQISVVFLQFTQALKMVVGILIHQLGTTSVVIHISFIVGS